MSFWPYLEANDVSMTSGAEPPPASLG